MPTLKQQVTLDCNLVISYLDQGRNGYCLESGQNVWRLSGFLSSSSTYLFVFFSLLLLQKGNDLHSVLLHPVLLAGELLVGSGQLPRSLPVFHPGLFRYIKPGLPKGSICLCFLSIGLLCNFRLWLPPFLSFAAERTENMSLLKRTPTHQHYSTEVFWKFAGITFTLWAHAI